MTTIQLETYIKAPIEAVFNLSLDIDFHKKSASNTREEAISGIISGQIGLGETVTWRGKHFGLWLTHTSIISEYETPRYFVDEMSKGTFKSFRHEHRFNKSGKQTLMHYFLTYEVPCGIIGRLFDFIFIKKHLHKFLKTRNLKLKEALERNFIP